MSSRLANIIRQLQKTADSEVKYVPLKWTRTPVLIGRSKMQTGEYQYTSTDKRFVITQRKLGSKTMYYLDVDGERAPRPWREHDNIQSAKYAANLIAYPDAPDSFWDMF